ncbi:MAG: Rne/Rng family ribonuclease, partial [Pseudomonadota bacterium]
MSKKMLIDATHPEETRVVVVDGNKVDDFDFESLNKRQLAGNIYLAKVTRVEPSLQAAFVDYGGNRHGFLAFSEIHPDYYQIPVADREALLAEEEAAARDEAEEDEGERKPKRQRRTRNAKRSKAAEAEADEAEAPSEDAAGDDAAESDAPAPAGLEVISVEADPVEAAAPDQPGDSVPDSLAVVEPDAPETAEDAASDDDTPPKTMAEDTGLDEETVSEEIGEGAKKPAKTAEEEAAPAEAAEAEAEIPAEESPAEEAAFEEAPTEESSPDETAAEAEAPPAEAPAEATAETAPEAPEEAEAASEDEGAKSDKPRKRQRRPRRKKGDAEETSAKADDKSDKADKSDTDDDSDDSDVEQVGAEDLQEEVAHQRARRRRRYKIQDVVKVRQIMLVQVVKEERGNKGAALTTYLSLAGRYCVLMPNTARGGGISRKITQVSDRKRLREIVDELEVPKGAGLIVRTAGAERTRAEIKRDYEFLSRQWEQVKALTFKSIAPTLIYEEGSLIKRSIRDLYSKEIDTILVEGGDGYREAKDYMKMLMPSHAKNVQEYTDQIPLFVRYQVESTLNGMFLPTVQLKSGGYIVIGITEALVAVDVNSGRATKQGSIEETALQTNLEAADEVARQCRLRDLAGLIVIDFIDMDE